MPKFCIGDIVVLRTHPFNSEITDVIISGEYLMTPPLMIVVEIIYHGVIDSESDNVDKFKCIWFSTKKNQFNESYFSESDLKRIDVEHDKDPIEIEVDNLVSLSTLPMELGKRRSFLNTETNQTGDMKSSNSVTGLLSFVSPVMTVIDIKIFDSSKDKKTSPEIKSKKTYPKQTAKCKWYNSVDEKFSECYIATEALMIIPKPPSELLSIVSEAITNKKCLHIGSILINPMQISCRSGQYYLNCFNLISQQIVTLPFSLFSTVSIVDNPVKVIAPIFKAKTQKGKKVLKLTVNVEHLINKAITRKKKNYIIIKYEDRLGTITNRTISKYSFIFGDDEENLHGPMIKYVRAYCHLRNAERNFRLTSISEASELKFPFES